MVRSAGTVDVFLPVNPINILLLLLCSLFSVLREMTAELPFTLTHPKPPESPKPTARSVSEPVVDMDLIQLDTK